MVSFLETVPAMLGGVATLQRTFIMAWTQDDLFEKLCLSYSLKNRASNRTSYNQTGWYRHIILEKLNVHV